MTTVAILPVSDASGQKSYRAVAGDKQSTGKTAGEALDALTVQLEGSEFATLLIIQSFRPDWFFSAEQQQRLSELMDLWRTARDRGESFPPEQQAEMASTRSRFRLSPYVSPFTVRERTNRLFALPVNPNPSACAGAPTKSAATSMIEPANCAGSITQRITYGG